MGLGLRLGLEKTELTGSCPGPSTRDAYSPTSRAKANLRRAMRVTVSSSSDQSGSMLVEKDWRAWGDR